MYICYFIKCVFKFEPQSIRVFTFPIALSKYIVKITIKVINNVTNFIKEKIMENQNNISNLRKILKQTVPIKPTSKVPTVILVNDKYVTDPVEIADAFNEYFTSINTTTTHRQT